jgi:hypothetical protein
MWRFGAGKRRIAGYHERPLSRSKIGVSPGARSWLGLFTIEHSERCREDGAGQDAMRL